MGNQPIVPPSRHPAMSRVDHANRLYVDGQLTFEQYDAHLDELFASGTHDQIVQYVDGSGVRIEPPIFLLPSLR